MGTAIAMASSGGRFGVARRPSVRKESTAFGHPSGKRLLGYRALDRRVWRPTCETVLARDVRRTD